MSARTPYFVPQPTYWPIIGAASLLPTTLGVATWLNDGRAGPYLFAAGAGGLAYALVGWLTDVIREGRRGAYDDQVEQSLRDGMGWFIFSEVVVFAVFFAALFYLRFSALPDLASGDTHALLWPSFKGGWPASGPGIKQSVTAMRAWGIPALNTVMLLTSGLAVTLASRAMALSHRSRLELFLLATIVLGALFLRNQASEYHRAYTALHITLASGAYGETFFFLTGLHGLHVAIGTGFLSVVLLRVVRGDFTAQHHVGFQAGSWYWHFVGVVWLIVFVVVYLL